MEQSCTMADPAVPPQCGVQHNKRVHLVADIRIPDSRIDQVLLMVVLTLVGLLLNRETWLWWQG